MPLAVSDTFLDTLAASDQTRIAKAEIWNGEMPQADLGTITAGQVSVDVTQPVRRTCTLSVNSQGLEYDDLVPTDAGSLLHPASGNELRIFRGFDYDPDNTLTWQQRLQQSRPNPISGVLLSRDGTVELCPLGVFRMTQPKVVDTGDSIVINVQGSDRASLVTRRKWLDVYPIKPGTDLRQAVHDLIQSRVPDLELTYKLAPTYGITVPATSFGLDLVGSNDPFADAITLSTAAAMELYFDTAGELVMQLVPNPLTINPSFDEPALYVEGTNCTMIEAERVLDETATYNGVIVEAIGSGGAPVKAAVWDTDPTSPTWVGGTWGYQPFITQTSLIPSSPETSGPVAYAQALKMAQTLFSQVRTMLDTPEFQCVPNPALKESDGVTLIRKRIGLNSEYTLAQMVIPLDTSSAEVITCRPKNIPLGQHVAPPFTLGAHGG